MSPIREFKSTKEKSRKAYIEEYTKSPNFLLDDWGKILKGNAFMIMAIILRKTVGYQKRHDIISYSQMQELSGLSKNTVIKCVKLLTDIGLIIKLSTTHKGKPVNYYTPNVYEDCELSSIDVNKWLYQCKNCTDKGQKTSAKIAPTKETFLIEKGIKQTPTIKKTTKETPAPKVGLGVVFLHERRGKGERERVQEKIIHDSLKLLDDGSISEEQMIQFSSKHSKENMNKFVKRVLNWGKCQTYLIGLRTVINRGEAWKDKETLIEEKLEDSLTANNQQKAINQEFFQSLWCYHDLHAKDAVVNILNDAIMVDFAGKGQVKKRVSDATFVKDVISLLGQIGIEHKI